MEVVSVSRNLLLFHEMSKLGSIYLRKLSVECNKRKVFSRPAFAVQYICSSVISRAQQWSQQQWW